MTTATEENPTSIPARYNVADAKIAELAEKYLPLQINGVGDKKGYAAMRSARLEIRALRGDVEKTRKDLKAESLEYGRKVDAEAKRITAALEEIETPLLARETAIDAEIQAVKDAEQKIITDRQKARYDALVAVGFVPDFTLHASLPGMSQDEFDALLEEKTEAFNFAEEKKAEDAALLEQLKAEQAKRDADAAAALETQRIEQAEHQAKLDEQAAEQAKVQARLDAAAKEQADREAAEKAAALLPDNEKLLAYAQSLRDVKRPEMATVEGSEMLVRFLAGMKTAIVHLG